jgi:hypothetical protein
MKEPFPSLYFSSESEGSESDESVKRGTKSRAYGRISIPAENKGTKQSLLSSGRPDSSGSDTDSKTARHRRYRAVYNQKTGLYKHVDTTK